MDMTDSRYKILAVVPARGGSKGIPRKNLCHVGGCSLVARVARVVQALDWITAAVVSTDDGEIADEARQHGLDVPFMRPAAIADDKALGIDVWRHAWLASEDHYQTRFDLSILLEPTSPLRTPADVTRTVETLLRENHAAAATVSRTPAHYSPHKTLTITADGMIGFYLPDGAQYSIRQTIPAYYHRNGICYAARRDHVVDERRIIDQGAAAIIMDRPVVNIDDPFDLQLAEWILQSQTNQETDGPQHG